MIPASSRIALLLSGLGLLLLTGCDRRLIQALTYRPSPTVVNSPAIEAPVPAQPPQTQAKTTTTQQSSTSYKQALDRAKSAAGIAQSAQSKDDWQLVVNRWQQAIDLLKTVPKSSRDYSQAQGKLQEYRRAQVQAQQRFNRASLPKDPDAVIVLAPSPAISPAASSLPTVPRRAAASPVSPPAASGADPRAFSAPIVRRAGNTPVIRVLFNGNQPFDMILDTGASGTVITRPMAAALGVVPVSQARVNTASERNVTFPLGYVQSIEVGGAVAQNVMVAIAGPELDLGLLGHDFFGNYDLVIRSDRVEFRERG
ncbi:retropepsin-like aspartic protease family protein [Leptolyngbya ohadii]|uniref:retropepsin-like aspartic protease family protein n=1 Tax=Leptolyngbya ohadii TaxID=1962290 RepID=UPI000B598567|nr:retropepsin-like aspartic protease [Leptolyngbya ohadii]